MANPSTVDTLERRRKLEARRMRIAVIAGLIFAAVGLIAALLSFRGDGDFPLYACFPEWVASRDIRRECEGIATPESGNGFTAYTSIGDMFSKKFDRIIHTASDFLGASNSRHIAGVARSVAVFGVGIAVFFTYRALLADFYDANLQDAQSKAFKRFRDQRSHWLSVGLISLITMVSTYVVISGILIMLSDMFEGLKLPFVGASIVAAVFAGAAGFVMTYWASVVTTRELLVFGLLTFVIGLGGGFAVTEGSWWRYAVSAVGRNPRSELLFMTTLISVAAIFWILWLDVGKIIKRVVDEIAPDPHTFLTKNAFTIIRALYFLALICTVFVGVIPVIDQKDSDQFNHIVTLILHTGGAIVSMAIFTTGGMYFFTRWLPDRIFPGYFKVMSRALVAVCGVAVVLFILNETTNAAFLSLTALELILFFCIGLWLFFAVSNLLEYADTQDDLPADPAPISKRGSDYVNRQRQVFARGLDASESQK